jgi:hypothetical protein
VIARQRQARDRRRVVHRDNPNTAPAAPGAFHSLADIVEVIRPVLTLEQPPKRGGVKYCRIFAGRAVCLDL